MTKPLVDEVSTKITESTRGLHVLSYPATIDLSTSTLRFLAGQLRAHRVAISSPWRRLSPGRQALLVLAHLRCGDTYARLAAGFGIGLATVCRYVHEAIDVLAAAAPTLGQAVTAAARAGWGHLVLDGTLVRTDRLAADRPYYSGKHHHHGINIQALTNPRGHPIWTSPGLPGSTHDLTAARAHAVIATCAEADMLVLADKGYHGAGGTVHTPYKGRHLTPPYRDANRSHAALRALGERGFATLKSWRIMAKVRSCPQRIGHLTAAITVLETHG